MRLHTMYYVHCTVYIVQCTVYNVHCMGTLYSIQCTRIDACITDHNPYRLSRHTIFSYACRTNEEH